MQSATFHRFTEHFVGPHGLLHALDRRWRPTRTDLDPRGYGQRLLQTAGDGDWLSERHLAALTDYIADRCRYYSALAADQTAPEWARAEWADAVEEHETILTHMERAANARPARL
jgi:hypothetical protein